VASHRGVAFDEACGDQLWLDLRVEGGQVRDAAYRVAGCAGAIAAGSALVVLLPGRAASPDAVVREDVEAVLDGIPGAKRHALGLALRAWRAALAHPGGPLEPVDPQ